MSNTLVACATRLRANLEKRGAGLDFNAAALQLFRLQYESCPPYRRWCDFERVSPSRVARWEQIPALPTSAFQELEVTSLPQGERVAVFHSSGTTGHRPSRHFHGSQSLELYDASAAIWFSRCLGFDEGSAGFRLISLSPTPESAPHSSLVHMLATLAKRGGVPESAMLGTVNGAGWWELDYERTVAALSGASCQRVPWLVVGTAFQFVHLMEYLDRKGARIELPIGTRVLETGGYKGRSRSLPRVELHQGIAQMFGIPRDAILREYGMSELSSQAYDTGPDRGETRWLQFPPWARVLAVSPEDNRPVPAGEAGLLRIYDLANVWSVTAIQTGDLGVVNADGRFELLGRAPKAEPRGCSWMTDGGKGE